MMKAISVAIIMMCPNSTHAKHRCRNLDLSSPTGLELSGSAVYISEER